MAQNLKRFVSLTGIYSLGNLTENVLGFFFIPIYTSFLSTGDYGLISLMLITVSMVTRFAITPINSALFRYYYAPEYSDKQGCLIFNLFLLLLAKTVILLLIFLSAKNFLAEKLLSNKNLVYIVELYAVILFFEPLSIFFESILQILEKAKYFVYVSVSKLILSATLTLYLLIWLHKGVMALIWSYLFGAVFTFVTILPLFIRMATFKLAPRLLVAPLKYSYPLILAGYSNFLIQAGDRYVLRIFNSLSTVGLYSFGYRFAGIINMALNAPMKLSLQPIVFKLENDPSKLKELLNRYARYFYIVSIFLCLFISLFCKEAIWLFARKQEFWGSWIIVPIIAFSYVQHGLLNFFSKGFVMAKKSWYGSLSVSIAAIVNIGLNFIFIPIWGIIGAALATLISYFVWNGLYIYYSAKFYKLHFDLGRLARITLIGVGLYLCSYVVPAAAISWKGLLYKFFLALCFPLILFISGFITNNEKVFLKKLVFKALKIKAQVS
jgi:O-antigen/teichoic acid export membrane protein